MLPLAARIGEAEVDIFNVFVLDSLENVLGSRHFTPLVDERNFWDLKVGSEGKRKTAWKPAITAPVQIQRPDLAIGLPKKAKPALLGILRKFKHLGRNHGIQATKALGALLNMKSAQTE
jgi:hypothetical protein